LIDPQGKLRKVYENVQANGHEALLLKDIEEIQRVFN
jgi:peroxiredoxin